MFPYLEVLELGPRDPVAYVGTHMTHIHIYYLYQSMPSLLTVIPSSGTLPLNRSQALKFDVLILVICCRYTVEYTYAETSSWISLPRDLARRLFSPSLQLPLPIALHVIHPHAETEQFTQPLYFSWPGTSCENGHVAIPGPVASALGLPSGTQVTVTPLSQVPTATSVTIEPSSPDDWEIVQLNADRLEETLLSQLAVASKEQPMFMWVNNQLIRFVVESTLPPAPVVKLIQGTELAIAPRTRSTANVDQGGKTSQSDTKEETVSVALRIQPLEDVHEHSESTQIDALSTIKSGVDQATYSGDAVVLSFRTALSFGLKEGQWVKLQSKRKTSLYGRVTIAEDNGVCADNHAGVRLTTCSALGSRPFDILHLQSLTPIELEALGERLSRQGGALLEERTDSWGEDEGRHRLSQIRSTLATATDSMTRIQRTAAELILETLLPILSFAPRDILSSWKAPRRGSVVLEGPHGSGKSWLVKTLGRMLSTHPGCLTAVDIVQCHKLSSEPEARQCIKSAVSTAFSRAPALIVLDDLDVICPAAMPIGGQGEDGQHPAAGGDMVPMDHGGFTAWLCDILDELVTPVDRDGWAPVAILATCREATGLATPLREIGRFDSVATLSVATSAEHRSDMIRASAVSRGVSVDTATTDAVAPKADCFDFGDIGVLLDRAVAVATRRYVINSDSPLTNGLHLIKSDFDEALEGMVPSALWGSLEGNTVGVGLQGWQDVGGLTTVCEALRESIELPLLYPHLIDSAPLRLRTGILLYGPPGCGKTHIVSAAVAAIGVRCITVSGPEVLNKYIGASEAAVRDVFKKAASAAPCVLFFDEFDAIAPRRGHDNTGVTDRVVNQMLTELDGVEGQLKGVTVVAATSRPDLIDPALLRPGRLDRLLLCDFPHSVEERVDILKALSRSLELEDGVDLRQVALAADGFSGADLGSVLSEAQLSAAHDVLRDLTDLTIIDGKQDVHYESGTVMTTMTASDTDGSNGDGHSAEQQQRQDIQRNSVVVIRQRHLLEALKTSRPSVSTTERRRLARIYQSMQNGVDSFDGLDGGTMGSSGGDELKGVMRKKVTLA